MKHVVYFSGGVGSWAAAKRVVAAHGPDDVTLLFADTKSEDCDLYRFLDDAEKNIGIPITRLAEGRDIWQVFNDVRFIGNSRVDPCSKVLKRDVLDKWRNDNCTPDDSIHYIGFEWSEGHRVERLRKRVAPWNYQFPMLDRPLMTKAGMINWLTSEGIRPPRLYEMGMPHNNCAGFCIKAGHGQFRQLFKVLPNVYAYHEKQEELLRQKLDSNVSILKDRTGGETTPLTLRVFRERIESQKTPSLFEDEDWGGCGCATDYDESDLVQSEAKA